jgi:hypothetical protein
VTWHRYDKVSKWLIQHFATALLRLGGEGNVVSCEPQLSEVVQPGQLPDGLLRVVLEGQPQPVRYLIELGTKAEPRLTEQMQRGMMLVYLNFGELPEALAFILNQRGKYQVPSGVEVASPRGTGRLALTWKVVELWTVPAEPLLATNDVGLVPWMPLLDFRSSPEAMLQECRRRIERGAPEGV